MLRLFVCVLLFPFLIYAAGNRSPKRGKEWVETCPVAVLEQVHAVLDANRDVLVVNDFVEFRSLQRRYRDLGTPVVEVSLNRKSKVPEVFATALHALQEEYEGERQQLIERFLNYSASNEFLLAIRLGSRTGNEDLARQVENLLDRQSASWKLLDFFGNTHRRKSNHMKVIILSVVDDSRLQRELGEKWDCKFIRSIGWGS